MLPQLESGKVTMLEDIYLNPTHHTYQTPPQSSVGESSSLIWLVLFSTVIVLSLFVNTIFFAAVVSTRKISKIHLFLFLFFIINLLEYSLLIFEFSLGTGNHYPYSDGSCSVYQMLLQGNPLLSAGALILFVYHAYSATFLSQPRLILLLSLIIFTQLVLSIPSFLYSGLAVYPSGARYCVMDLGGVSSWAGMPMERQQMATALYYLMYKPILSYWLPICLLTAPLVKMGKLVNTTMDDQFNITLTITITISYGVFHLPHATTMFVRHFLAICSYNLSYRDRWLLDVLQSLFLLISYFFHLFRPLVCLVLDPDILASLYRNSYKLFVYREKNMEKSKVLDLQSEIVP